MENLQVIELNIYKSTVINQVLKEWLGLSKLLVEIPEERKKNAIGKQKART